MAQPLLSAQFEYALAYAAHLHRHQARKETRGVIGIGDGPEGPELILGTPREQAEAPTPYVCHLLSVAGIVLQNHGTEEEAIAALLHDAVEDCGGRTRLIEIGLQFGLQVTKIVRDRSDSLEHDPEKKEEWKPRKERYLRRLREKRVASVYLVSSADKLDSARATLTDLRNEGPVVWERFKGKREGTLWLYDELIAAYEAGPPDKRREPIVRELKEVVSALHGLA